MTHDIRRFMDAVQTLCEAVDLTNVYRDALGKPKMFYHGTVDEFAEFDPKKVHDREGVSLKLGFGPGVLYFTDNPNEANQYATRRNLDGANIRPVYLIMRKPLRIKHWDDKASGWLNAAARGYGSYMHIKGYAARMRRFIRDLRADGYDSIVLGSEHVVFDADQVISTIAARGDDALPTLTEAAAKPTHFISS